MAITITQNPQTISPGCNPFEWVFESTNTANDNFSFIVELEINGVYHSTHEVFVQSATSGRFDASEILRSFLFSNLVTDGTLSQVYTGAFCSVGINVFEKFGTPPAVQPEPESSVKATAFNGSLRHQDFILWDYEYYNASNYNPLTDSPTQVKFLTTIPREIRRYVGIDQSCFLGIFSLDEDVRINFRLFSATGSTIANESVNLTFPALAIIDCSPQTIISNTSITALNFQDCVYYRVLVQGMAPLGTYSGASESFEFYMDTECKRYEQRRLHWLNKFGVWDSMSFDLDSIDTTDVQSNDYARNTGVWNNGVHSYPLYQGQMINASKTSTDKTTITSDWMKPELQQWLVRELGESPRVYLEVSNGFEPVKVTNTSYLLKTRKRNGLIQEQFTLERTYIYTSQLN